MVWHDREINPTTDRAASAVLDAFEAAQEAGLPPVAGFRHSFSPISSSFGSPRYSGMPSLTIELQSWDRRSWRTYEKKFAAWESIVERANRVFTIQTMRNRAPACCVDPDQPVETAVSPTAIALQAIEIRSIEVRSRHLGRPIPSNSAGYPGNRNLDRPLGRGHCGAGARSWTGLPRWSDGKAATGSIDASQGATFRRTRCSRGGVYALRGPAIYKGACHRGATSCAAGSRNWKCFPRCSW
jgi:hypothetical protein